MSTEDKKRCVRKLVVDEEGKRDSEGSLNKKKNLSDKFCNRPFDFFESHDLGTGKVFVCCPTWVPTSIGDLAENEVNDVFNSEAAQKIRKSILDGTFEYCDCKICPLIQNDSLPSKAEVEDPRHKEIIKKNIIKDLEPVYYNLCYDESCNLSCPSCRRHKIYLKEGDAFEHKQKIQDKIIKNLFLKPHSKYAEVNITGSGDPFGSKLFRDLLFSIDGSICPNVKINLQTNGVMFTPKYWDKMKKIQKNISTVLISLDAATEEVYDITRRGGNWKVLMKNLKFISKKLRKNNLIDFLRLDFVVQKANYKDMAEFIKIGKRLNVDGVYFSLVIDWGTWVREEYEDNAVWKKTNLEFQKFIKVMENPIFDDPIVDLGNATEYRNYAKSKRQKDAR